MSTDPDQIRAEIERTRADLSYNVDVLADKVSPSSIVERRVDSAKGAITSVKERVMGTTTHMADSVTGTASSATSSAHDKASSLATTASDAVHGAPGAAKSKASGNPLAAGLIAFGAGWLISSLLPASEKETQLAGQVKDAALEHKDAVTEPLKQAAADAKDALQEPAQEAFASVKETATDAVGTVKEQGQSAAQDVTSQAQDAKDAVQETRSGDSETGDDSGYQSTNNGWAGGTTESSTPERPYGSI